jgi:hypothetical protein
MRYKLFFLLLTISLYNALNAQKAAGAEIFYEQLDSLKYLVTANVFRKCNTDSLTSVKAYLQVLNNQEIIHLKRISIENISDSCGNPCNIQNKNSNFGFEKHTWIDTVDLSLAKYQTVINGNCGIRFKLEVPIDNELEFYNTNKSIVECFINLCHSFGKIKSPQFNIRPKFMTPLNQAYIHNPGIVKDNEDDSLGFSLEMPLFYEDFFNNPPPSINFTPYCPAIPGSTSCRPQPNARPPRGFYFDNVTSDVIFTPTVNNQNGILTIVCHLYRKDLTSNQPILLGSVMREYILYVRDQGNNSPPYFTSSNRYSKCKDLDLILNLPSKDDNTSDTIKLDWNNSSNNISFNIVNDTLREKTAQVKLSSSSNVKVTQDYFALIAHDGNCHSEISRGYVVTSLPNPRIANFSKDLKGCNQYIIQFEDSISSRFSNTVNYQYQLTLLSDTFISFKGSKNTDTISYSKTGRYALRLSVKNNPFGCENNFLDTIQLNPVYLLESQQTDTALCLNNAIVLGNNTFNDSNTKLKWEYPAGQFLSDSSNSITIKNNQLTSKVKLNVQNSFCKKTFELDLKSEYNVELSISDTSICKNQMVNVGLLNVVKDQNDSIFWSVNNQSVQVANNQYLLAIDSFKHLVVKLKHKNCEMTKSVNISAIQLPQFEISDSIFCNNKKYTIIPKYIDSIRNNYEYKWMLGADSTGQTSDSLIWKFSNENQLSLEVKSPFGCYFKKALNLNYYENPMFELSDSIFCPNSISTIRVIPNFNTGTSLFYKWFLDDSLVIQQSNSLTANFDDFNKVQVVLNDHNGCFSEKAIPLNFYTNPQFKFEVNSNCKDSVATITAISQNLGLYFNWIFNQKPIFNESNILSLVMNNGDNIKLTIIDSNQCVYQDSIQYFSLLPPEFSILGDTLYNIDDTVKLTVSNRFNSYLWSNGSKAQSTVFKAKELGVIGPVKISCEVMDSNYCIHSKDKVITIEDHSSVKKYSTLNNSIFPNPAQTKLFVFSGREQAFIVYDVFGRVILQADLHVGLNELNINQLNSGVYYAKLDGHVLKFQKVSQ